MPLSRLAPAVLLSLHDADGNYTITGITPAVLVSPSMLTRSVCRRQRNHRYHRCYDRVAWFMTRTSR